MQLLKPIGTFLAHTAFTNSQNEFYQRPQGRHRIIKTNSPSDFFPTKPRISAVMDVSESHLSNVVVSTLEKGNPLSYPMENLGKDYAHLPGLPRLPKSPKRSPASRKPPTPDVIGSSTPTRGHSESPLYPEFNLELQSDLQSVSTSHSQPQPNLQSLPEYEPPIYPSILPGQCSEQDRNEMKNLKNKIVELQNALMVKTMELKMSKNLKKSPNYVDPLEIRINLEIGEQDFLEKCKFMKKKLLLGFPLTLTIKMNGDPSLNFVAAEGVLKLVLKFLQSTPTIFGKYKQHEDKLSINLIPKKWLSEIRLDQPESLGLLDPLYSNEHTTNHPTPPKSYSELPFAITTPPSSYSDFPISISAPASSDSALPNFSSTMLTSADSTNQSPTGINSQSPTSNPSAIHSPKQTSTVSSPSTSTSTSLGSSLSSLNPAKLILTAPARDIFRSNNLSPKASNISQSHHFTTDSQTSLEPTGTTSPTLPNSQGYISNDTISDNNNDITKGTDSDINVGKDNTGDNNSNVNLENNNSNNGKDICNINSNSKDININNDSNTKDIGNNDINSLIKNANMGNKDNNSINNANIDVNNSISSNSNLNVKVNNNNNSINNNIGTNKNSNIDNNNNNNNGIKNNTAITNKNNNKFNTTKNNRKNTNNSNNYLNNNNLKINSIKMNRNLYNNTNFNNNINYNRNISNNIKYNNNNINNSNNSSNRNSKSNNNNFKNNITSGYNYITGGASTNDGSDLNSRWIVKHKPSVPGSADPVRPPSSPLKSANSGNSQPALSGTSRPLFGEDRTREPVQSAVSSGKWKVLNKGS